MGSLPPGSLSADDDAIAAGAAIAGLTAAKVGRRQRSHVEPARSGSSESNAAVYALVATLAVFGCVAWALAGALVILPPVPRTPRRTRPVAPRPECPTPRPTDAGGPAGTRPVPPPSGDEAILLEIARLAGLERRLDPVDGHTVLFELLPGYREVREGGEDDEKSTMRLELKAHVRSDASLPESVATLLVEVRFDSRTRTVLSARRVLTQDGDDAELEKLTRQLRR